MAKYIFKWKRETLSLIMSNSDLRHDARKLLDEGQDYRNVIMSFISCFKQVALEFLEKHQQAAIYKGSN